MFSFAVDHFLIHIVLNQSVTNNKKENKNCNKEFSIPWNV